MHRLEVRSINDRAPTALNMLIEMPAARVGERVGVGAGTSDSITAEPAAD